MKLLKVIFFLIPFWAFGQYQNSPNKAVLGNQTTGKGLIYYGSGAPAYTPINNKNAYHYVDTTTDVFWYWDFTSMLWDTVTVSGGGGGGTDSQVIDTFTYSSDTLKLSMSGDGQMYKYIVIPGSSDDQNIDTFSVVTDTIRLSLQSDGQKYKYINLLPYKDNTDTQTIYWNSGTGNLTIFGGNAISLDGRYLTTEADGSITNELQTIDTFSISSNTLRASLSSDGQAFKTVDLSPYLDNTDSQVIDTFSFSSDTLRISVSGDGQKYKTIYLPSVADTDDQNLSFGTKTGVTIPLNITDGAAVNFDEGTNIEITRDASNYITFKGTTTIDTATYLSDTLKLSLTNDGQAAKKIFIPQIEDTDDQTLLRSFDTIFISQGNYVILPVDINTDNQAFDTAQISSDTLRLSLEGDLVPVYKFNLKPYLDNTDAQVVDTFNYSLDTLRLSIFGDGEKYKTIYLPNITDTDDQYIDTLDISGNNLRISLHGDNQALKTVSLSPYLDNTDSQTIDTMDIYGGVFLRTSLSGDGQSTKLVDLSNFYNLLTVQTKSGNILPLRSSTVTTDLSVTEGDNITLSKNGTYQFTIDARPTIDTFSYSSDTLRMSIYGDQQKYKTVYIPAGADDQTLSISAGKGTISISEGNSIQLADSTITNEGTLGVSAGAANTSVITSNTSGANGVTVQASGIISISESTSSNGGTITLTAVESDGSSTNELQTLSISGGKGSITLSAGGGTVTLNDSSSTNEIQTIDTFDLNSNNLRLSISSDGQALKTVSLASYLDNTDSQTIDTFSYSLDTIRLSITGDAQKYKTIYVPSISDTDDQSLSFGTKSGVTIPLNIQDGSGVNFDEGTNIEITRDASNYITFKGKTTLDTVSVVTDTARVSLTNDGQAYKTIPLSEYRQKVDTFSFSSDTIRISLTGDQERYKAIYLPNVTDTDDQYIDTFRVNSGNVELSLNGDGRAVSTVAVISIAPVQAVSAGTGISVSGTSTITVTNTGDLSTSNEIQTIDTFEINSNTLRLSLEADGQAYKTVDLSKYVDTTFAVNGTRISNDTLYWGSQSSSTDNGSALIHDTYIWQGGNDLTFFNNGDGPDKPVLYLSAVNDLWVGANSTSTAGTAGSADKPSIYFRYGNLGAYSFGVNTTSNLNALGNGATNFAKNGLASGNHSRNFQEDGIASSAHSINMGRSGEAKTDSYAWNSGAFGSAANFAAWNSGYDGDATNYYAFNTARVGLASGYSSVNMGESGVASGSDAKNFGNGGQASGTHAIGFSKFNVTSGNYGMNGSYYTESHAYGQSRWGYFGTDHNSQSSSGWVADNILFAIDNGKEDTVRSSALTASARGWFQLRDIGTTQTNITSAKQAPKAALEVVSTESGFIPPGGTLAQRNTIWNEGSQTGNFTATYTKGWQSISGSNIMDQNGLQFQVMNEYGGTSLYALRYNGSGYYWHQIY